MQNGGGPRPGMPLVIICELHLSAVDDAAAAAELVVDMMLSERYRRSRVFCVAR